MARPPSGSEHLAAAHEVIRNTRDADELRQALAVILPLEFHFSLRETAHCIGRSVGATSALRSRFSRTASGEALTPRGKKDLRNRAYLSLDEERVLLDELLAGQDKGTVSVTNELRDALEMRMGRRISVSSVYNMLLRHGWRVARA